MIGHTESIQLIGAVTGSAAITAADAARVARAHTPTLRNYCFDRTFSFKLIISEQNSTKHDLDNTFLDTIFLQILWYIPDKTFFK